MQGRQHVWIERSDKVNEGTTGFQERRGLNVHVCVATDPTSDLDRLFAVQAASGTQQGPPFITHRNDANPCLDVGAGIGKIKKKKE